MNQPDYRALCSELTFCWSRTTNPDDFAENVAPIVERMKAALAQPEPVGPTDEELRAAYDKVCWGEMDPDNFIKATRAVLARWAYCTPQPIPVSERLPGSEDCDGCGNCWWLRPGDRDSFPFWWLGCGDSISLHWLPFHDLPLPEVEA